jgi:hypothetical protein
MLLSSLITVRISFSSPAPAQLDQTLGLFTVIVLFFQSGESPIDGIQSLAIVVLRGLEVHGLLLADLGERVEIKFFTGNVFGIIFCFWNNNIYGGKKL